MKDLIRQPVFYYIAVPIVLAFWPVLVGLVCMPDTDQRGEVESQNYIDANDIMAEIGRLDPDRLKRRDDKEGAKFDYTVVMDAAARKIGIPSANYTISSKKIQRRQGAKTQDCQVMIAEIDIQKLSRFLTDLQVTWTNLQCQKLTITKKKGLKDVWKVDMTFKYYY